MPDRNFAEFETGNLTLSVIHPEGMGLEYHVSNNWIALHVDDVAATRQTLEERGVASTATPSTPACATWRSSRTPTATR